MGLMLLGCHNVVMFNHCTLLLGYLLLFGYDVTGKMYLYRLAGIGLGAGLTMIVYYRNHRKQEYKRGLKQLLDEFDFSSSRTKWQLRMTLGISVVVLLTGALHCPRRMWAGERKNSGKYHRRSSLFDDILSVAGITSFYDWNHKRNRSRTFCDLQMAGCV